MIRQKKYASRDVMNDIKQGLGDLLDENKLTWSAINTVNFKESFDLPFSGITAQKISKGYHVGRQTIMRGCEYFGIDYEIKNGLIVKAMEGEND